MKLKVVSLSGSTMNSARCSSPIRGRNISSREVISANLRELNMYKFAAAEIKMDCSVFFAPNIKDLNCRTAGCCGSRRSSSPNSIIKGFSTISFSLTWQFRIIYINVEKFCSLAGASYMR